jgi:hypothetical protein
VQRELSRVSPKQAREVKKLSTLILRITKSLITDSCAALPSNTAAGERILEAVTGVSVYSGKVTIDRHF